MKIKFSGMILAAGYGKRMMPLTKYLPKPLLDINGITLLENSINFLRKIGCSQILINTHYQNNKIEDFIKKIDNSKDITLIYEKEILDTGGGIKNAINHFENNNLIVINSDIFWRKDNLNDVKNLIYSYKNNMNPHLLLVSKNNANGIDKKNGDFNINNKKISRYNNEKFFFYYSGLQILSLNIFDHFSEKKFSINSVWDYLIKNSNLYGEIMNSDWFHVGDIQGLNLTKELCS